MSKMPPPRPDTPSYRVLQVIEVPPEVVSSSVGDNLGNIGRIPRSVVRAAGAAAAAASATPAPATPAPRQGNVFPDYIYVEYEGYMVAANPFWQPSRAATSCMYTFTSDQKGHVSCSDRMAQWLAGLPDPEAGSIGEGLSQQLHGHQPHQGVAQRHGKQRRGRPRGHSRPRSASAPPPPPNNLAHVFGGQEHPAATTAPIDGMQDQRGPAGPRCHHPNPLGQHPIVIEELPAPLRIPQRKSSLHFSLRNSQYNSQAPDLTAQEDQLVQGVESIRLATPVQLRDSAQPGQRQESSHNYAANNTQGPQADERSPVADAFSQQLSGRDNGGRDTATATATLRPDSSHIHQLFGSDHSRGNHRKHNRTETPVMIDALHPAKRIRGALSSAANRLSMMAPPAVVGTDDGRQSRLGRLSSAATKRFSMPAGSALNPWHDLPRGDTPVRVKLCVVGNTGCGKTELIQRFATGTFKMGKARTSQEMADGYSVETISHAVDNQQAVVEAWDVSSQCDTRCAFEDSVRPLLMTFFDAVVICFDVGDETTLEAAVQKWKIDAERYCPSAPVILVGLKSDLRRDCPTLKLNFLNEPTATTRGQGEQAASQMGAVAYFECSARTGEGVEDFFESVVRMALLRARREYTGPVTRVKKFLDKIKKRL